MPGKTSTTAGSDAKLSGQRPHAANNHHDERQHQPVHAHCIGGRYDRRIHHARNTSHRCGKAEHERKPFVDVDAKQAHSFTICHTRTNNHPKGGELQEGKHTCDNQRREEEVHEPPHRIDDGVRAIPKPHPKIYAPRQCLGGGGLDWVGAKVVFDHFAQNDGQAERHKDLIRMPTAIIAGMENRIASGTAQSMMAAPAASPNQS